MSQKLLDLGLDFDEIRERIDAEKGDTANNIWAEYVKVSKSLISKIHPKRHGKAPQAPSLEYVITVAKKTGKPTDWYLYGKMPENQAAYKVAETHDAYGTCADSLDTWSQEIKDACRQVRDILLSDNDMIKEALRSNLLAFQRLKSLEEQQKAKKNTGTNGDAS